MYSSASPAIVNVSRNGSVDIRPLGLPLKPIRAPTPTSSPFAAASPRFDPPQWAPPAEVVNMQPEAPAPRSPFAAASPSQSSPSRMNVNVNRNGSIFIAPSRAPPQSPFTASPPPPSDLSLAPLLALHATIAAQSGVVTKGALIAAARSRTATAPLIAGSFGGSDIPLERALRLFGRSGASEGDETISALQLERFAALHADALAQAARGALMTSPAAARSVAAAATQRPPEAALLQRSIGMLETLTMQRDDRTDALAAATRRAAALTTALNESEQLRVAAADQAYVQNEQTKAMLAQRDDAHRRALVAEQSLNALRAQMSKIAAMEVHRAQRAATAPDGRRAQAELAAQRELAIRQLGAELEAARRAAAEAQLIAATASEAQEMTRSRLAGLEARAVADAELAASRDQRAETELAMVEERHAGELAAVKRKGALALAALEVAAEATLQTRLDEIQSETDESQRRTVRNCSENELMSSQEIERLRTQLRLAGETGAALRDSLAASDGSLEGARRLVTEKDAELEQLRGSYSTVVRQRLADADSARVSLETVLEENRQLQAHVQDTSALHSEHIGVVQDSLGNMVEMRRVLIQVLSDEVPYTHYKVRLPDPGAVVRATPELSSGIVATLPFDTIVEVRERVVDERGMVRMRIASGGIEGWVSSFLRGNTTRIMAPTVVAPGYDLSASSAPAVAAAAPPAAAPTSWQSASPTSISRSPQPSPRIELATPAPSNVRINRNGSVMINTPMQFGV